MGLAEPHALQTAVWTMIWKVKFNSSLTGSALLPLISLFLPGEVASWVLLMMDVQGTGKEGYSCQQQWLVHLCAFLETLRSAEQYRSDVCNLYALSVHS